MKSFKYGGNGATRKALSEKKGIQSLYIRHDYNMWYMFLYGQEVK